MQDGEDGGETESGEHAGSKWSPKREPEFWVYRYSSAADANCSDLLSYCSEESLYEPKVFANVPRSNKIFVALAHNRSHNIRSERSFQR